MGSSLLKYGRGMCERKLSAFEGAVVMVSVMVKIRRRFTVIFFAPFGICFFALFSPVWVLFIIQAGLVGYKFNRW